MKKLITRSIAVIGVQFILWISIPCFSQDMKAGFEMLEQGKFSKAKGFFTAILSDEPNNQTAKLCYARATGLSGDPKLALNIFNEMTASDPNNMEYALNKAEAQLWMKEPQSAIKSYHDILTKDPSLFVAQLGLANSYSMNKQYDLAYQQILVAETTAPKNGQVIQSKKYIILALSNQLASEKNDYKGALNLLAANLTASPEDYESLTLQANVLMMKGDLDQALETYQLMNNPYDELKGQSMILHLKGDDESALAKASELLIEAETNKKGLLIEAQKHYVSALLWNNQIANAKRYLQTLVEENPNSLRLSLAQVAMYESDFTGGVDHYQAYLNNDSASFNANLGTADAMHALGMDNKAYEYAFKTLEYYPGQKDAQQFITKLNHQHSIRASTKYGYEVSSDGSKSKTQLVSIDWGMNPLTHSNLKYQKRRLTSKGSVGQSTAETFSYSLTRKLTPSIGIQAAYGMIKINQNGETTNSYNQQLNLSTSIRVNKSHQTKVGYYTEILDFNENLLNQKLQLNHFKISHSAYWKLKGLGWYTEWYRSTYSDTNVRNLAFTSIYRTPMKYSFMKFGVNYQIMKFAESKPTEYYSPENYNQIEAFYELNLKQGKKLPIDLLWSFATGYLKAGQQSQHTWRTQLALKKSAGRFNFEANYSYSSIASAETNGFNHTSINGAIRFRLASKPSFYKKVSQSGKK